jgi:branched-subunit amino acid transport protein
MAGVTYMVRLLPILFIRRKIKNRFIRSFLYYIPYAVLTVMTAEILLLTVFQQRNIGILIGIITVTAP